MIGQLVRGLFVMTCHHAIVLMKFILQRRFCCIMRPDDMKSSVLCFQGDQKGTLGRKGLMKN